MQVTTPLLNSKGALNDDLGLATRSGVTGRFVARIDVLDQDAPTTGRVRVLNRRVRMAWGRVVPSVEVIATAAARGRQPVVFIAERGAILADGSEAAGPRAGFLLSRQAVPYVRDEAEELFGYLVERLL